VTVIKNATHLSLSGSGTCLRRYRAPSGRVAWSVCAAQYFLPNQPIARMATGKVESSVVDSDTTLVLEPELADFSTDAGNSALIFETESPQRHVAPFRACAAAKKNNKKSNSRFCLATIGFTWEGTPCHGEDCLDDNS